MLIIAKYHYNTYTQTGFRSKYGETFVIDIPEIESETFKWFAVNHAYAKEYQGN